MDKSRFDEMIKKILTRCRLRAENDEKSATGLRENAVTVASKLLEINYAMGDIEHELDEYKSVIIENLQRHESTATVIGHLRAVCEKLVAFDGELKDFEDNARPRLIEIEEARNAFLHKLRDQDENRENDAVHAQKLREIIREIIEERDEIVAEINTEDQGIAFLTAQLEDIAARINIEKIQNAAFYASVQHKQNDLLRRSYELVAKLNELLASKDWKETRKVF